MRVGAVLHMRQCYAGLQLLDREKGDIQLVMKQVKAFEWDGKIGIRQPEPAYVLNLEARINTVHRKWEKRHHDAT